MKSLHDPEVEESFRRINQGYWFVPGEVPRGKRGPLGFLLTWIKRGLHRIIYPPLAYIFETQKEFNAGVVHILNHTREALQSADLEWQERSRELSEQLAGTKEQVASIERRLLEWNHFRYAEIRDLDQKLLALNHDRYVEAKRLEHLFHTELLGLRGEVANVAYAFVHLEKKIAEVQHDARNRLAEIAGDLNRELAAAAGEKHADLSREMTALRRDVSREIAVTEEHSNVIARETILPRLAEMQGQVSALQDRLAHLNSQVASIRKALLQPVRVKKEEATATLLDPQDEEGEAAS